MIISTLPVLGGTDPAVSAGRSCAEGFLYNCRIVSELTSVPTITGEITAAPNPIPPLAAGCTTISWETNDPLGAEIHVLTPDDGEKLVARGTSGRTDISWIAASKTYTFHLYGSSEPNRSLAQVTVERSDASVENALDQLADDAVRGNIGLEALARFVGRIAPRCVRNPRFPEFFRLWEEQGVHITPVHFYQPIPDTRTLSETLWTEPSALAGLNMNEAVQLDLLHNCFPKFRDEYLQFPVSAPEGPEQFYLDNGRFGGTDALVAYCMVRHFKPKTIIEIGSGYSSLISGAAAAKNGSPALVCVEPYPLEFLTKGFPGLRSLVQQKVEDLRLEFFSQLQSGDILFIDSSHTVKIGGDVNYLFLEVLPRLDPGVIVHIHDILLPFDYRRDWVMDELRFWTEQYLLQAFLAHNSEFEVLFANNYMGHYHLPDFEKTFPHSPWSGGGSFWIRRCPPSSTHDRI